MSESPLSAEFWDSRYRRERTPWQTDLPPAALSRYLEANPGGGRTVLIPGCGSGSEIEIFAAAGYRVCAIDFSPTAVSRARARVRRELAADVVVGDFFTHTFPRAPFDLIYERAFLCALPPEKWPEIGNRTADLLKPNGLLVGVYFYGRAPDGPPFGLTPERESAVFDRRFVTISVVELPEVESLLVFAGHERWVERRRRVLR